MRRQSLAPLDNPAATYRKTVFLASIEFTKFEKVTTMVMVRAQTSKQLAPGISLTELLVALAILATTAVGVFQLMSLSEIQLLQSRNALTDEQLEGAIGSYVYDDFLDGSLADNSSIIDYDLSGLPADLQRSGLKIATIFGNQPRYEDNATQPKCRLSSATNEVIGSISFPADCVIISPNSLVNSVTIAQNINKVLKAKARIGFGVQNAGGHCTASQPMDDTITGHGQIATLLVDDPNCLKNATSGQPAAHSEIIFPRFVAYSSEYPPRYYTSFVESAIRASRGVVLSAPNTIAAVSGARMTLPDMRLSAPSKSDTGIITITANSGSAFIEVSNANGANLAGDNTSSAALTGTFAQLKKAIRTITYRSAASYLGKDEIVITARSGPLSLVKTIIVTVSSNKKP